MKRHYNDLGLGLLSFDQLCGLQSVDPRHGYIHEHDIGLKLPGQADSLLSIRSLPNDTEIRIFL